MLQTKLKVGPANDHYEQEADRVASSVMRQINSSAKPEVSGAEEGIQRSHGEAELDEEEDDESLQRKITPINTRSINRKAVDHGQPSQPIGMQGGAIDSQMESTIQRQRGGGRPLDDSTRTKMESAFGTDFSGVKIHTSTQADQLNRSINADAFTTGQDVFFRSGNYSPQSAAGQKLLAHELTHVVQQTGKKSVQRKDHKPGVQVNGTLPSNRISTKARMMHLDFVVMKRKDVDYKYVIGKKLGFKVKKQDPDGGTWGHYWTEVGDNEDMGFRPRESYGWWPDGGAGGLKGAIKGVQGILNQGDGDKDPYQGDNAPTTFHPVMKVDPDNESYKSIRDRVTKEIRDFAHGFSGSWNWRLGWGKNCQTFQDRLKKKVGLHYQKSKEWLRDPEIERRRAEQEKAEQDRQENFERANQAVVGQFTVPQGMTVEAIQETTTGDTEGRTFAITQDLPAGGEQIGATGRAIQGLVQYRYAARQENLVEYTYDGDVYWMTDAYWKMYFGQDYPTGGSMGN